MNKRGFFAAALCALIALAPALAEARAGSGSSSGSRGSRTQSTSPAPAAPIQRSVTPATTTPTPGSAVTAPRPGMPATAAAGGSFFQRNPFMAGMMGGLLGVGIGSLLFGGSFGGMGGSGFGTMLGILLQIALIGGLAYLAFRLIRGRRAQTAGGPAMYQGLDSPQHQPQQPSGGGLSGFGGGFGGLGGGLGGGAPAAAPAATRGGDPVEIPITDGDYEAWGHLLANIQRAWSNGDVGELRRYVTPEMVSYFADDMTELSSRGVRNVVEDVQLLKGDLHEAWAENGREYATALIKWSAKDYTVRLDNGQVVDGDPSRPVEAEEVWTFVRSHGGQWLLSAIQQVR